MHNLLPAAQQAADPTEMAEPMPEGETTERVILAQGQFYDLTHEGMGTATVYRRRTAGSSCGSRTSRS